MATLPAALANLQLPFTLTEKQKKWARLGGYVLFGILVFFYAVHLSIPYDRIEQILQDKLGDGFDVRVESAGPGFFPGDVVLKGVTLKSHPAREGDKPVELTIDRLDLDLGVFAGLRGVGDVAFEATLGAGKLEGRIIADKNEQVINVHSHELPLDQLPGIRTATGGVPMAGGISIDMDVTVPKGKWANASGKIAIDCEACTIGDGVSKIRPTGQGQQNAFSEGGFTLPKLKLGKIGGKLNIVKGLAHFEEFVGKSPDGELYLDGDIQFADPFVTSRVTAYMRFKAADALVQRESKMGDIIMMMKGQAFRPEDGLMGIKIIGPFNGLKFISSKVSPVPVGGAAGKDGARPRPTLGGLGGRGVSDGSDGLRPPVNPNPAIPQPSGIDAPPTPPPQVLDTPTPPPTVPEQPPGSMTAPPSGMMDVRAIPSDAAIPQPTNEAIPPPTQMVPPPPPPEQQVPPPPPASEQQGQPQGQQNPTPPPQGDYGQQPVVQ
jgi:type II secretion system protein N